MLPAAAIVAIAATAVVVAADNMVAVIAGVVEAWAVENFEHEVAGAFEAERVSEAFEVFEPPELLAIEGIAEHGLSGMLGMTTLMFQVMQVHD